MSDTQDAERVAARMALENADGLYEDAGLLYDHQRYARALSLAIIGQEEAGKTVLYSIASVGLSMVVREAMERSARNPLFNHAFKQVTMVLVSAADIFIDDETDTLAALVAGELSPSAVIGHVERLLSECADSLEAGLREHDVQAGRIWYERLREDIAQASDLPDHGLPVRDFETPEEEKWRGLYVNPERPTGQPHAVTRSDAGFKLMELEKDLDTLAGLRQVLADDHSWDELKRRVLPR